MTDEEQVEQVREWFDSKGFALRAERRDMRAELEQSGNRNAVSATYPYWVDLISLRTGNVFHRSYGSGPTEQLAIIATEQRWLVEQDGQGSATGKTYVDMAKNRLQGQRG